MFIYSLLCEPRLAHLAKIEQRAASRTPETRYRESNANDPYEQRDDDPTGHGVLGYSIGRVAPAHPDVARRRC